MLRQEISQALTTALKAQEKRRMSTLRLVMAAVKDRDIANRTAGKDPVGDEELLGILGKMVKQREESARIYEEQPSGTGGSRARGNCHYFGIPAAADDGRRNQEGL